MRDDCVMTMVHCPYEGAGCTFHVSCFYNNIAVGIHFKIIHPVEGKRLNQVKTQSKYT